MKLIAKAAFTLAMSVASSAFAAQSCESIRTMIDAKIRSAGVSNFTLTTVEASATASGKTVGTCDQGTKKIMYELADSSARPSAGISPVAGRATSPPSTGKPMLTECKDGSVSMGGDCKK